MSISVGMVWSPDQTYTTGLIRLIGIDQDLPEGWLYCDQRVYRSEDYPALAETINYTPGADSQQPEEFSVPNVMHTSVAGVHELLRGIIKT